MLRTPPVHTLLRVNALFAAVTGLTAIALTGLVAQLIGVGQHRLVSATGGGLVMFALGLVIASGAATSKLIPAARLISIADALWVVGSIVVVAFADLPPAGTVVLCTIAAIVASFALLQMWATNLVDHSSPNQVVEQPTTTPTHSATCGANGLCGPSEPTRPR